jgi:hypothetical protein
MKLFKRKPKPPARASAGPATHGNGTGENGGQLNQKQTVPPASHILTMDLARSENLARMLAASRASNAVEVADLLAGMYIYEWDRLSKYWDNEDEVEKFLQTICKISPQRWHSWIELYDKKQHIEEPKSKWSPLRGRKQKQPAPEEKPLPRSSEVELLLRNAEVITPFHDKHEGRSLPILTSESVLLCIALNRESEIGRKLAETGLDIASLERAARDRRRAPLAWRDGS